MIVAYTSLMAKTNTVAANKARIECARLEAAVALGKDPGYYVPAEFSSYSDAAAAKQPGQKVLSATVSGGPKRFILVPVRRTDEEIFQDSMRQMLADWTDATPEQRAEALRLAALSAGKAGR